LTFFCLTELEKVRQENNALKENLRLVEKVLKDSISESNEAKVIKAQYEGLQKKYEALRLDLNIFRKEFDQRDSYKNETIENLVEEYSKLGTLCFRNHTDLVCCYWT
jgi:archaellum component FlaC